MEKKTISILVVDDEVFNLEAIAQSLAADQYHVTCVESGEEALWLLMDDQEHFDIVLLDRMMPGIDGMDVLTAIKAEPRIRHIPVIMQTAVAEQKAVIEGIQAGAYYYLTKPFNRDMLVSLVRAAEIDVLQWRIDQEELKQSRLTLGMVDRCTLKVRTLDEAKKASLYLSYLYPNPEDVHFGIHELIINAIEHGNLGVGYDKKTDLLREGCWREEIERRLTLPENANKYAEIHYFKNNDTVSLIIKDEGEGFEWEEYLEVSPHRVADNHGRGIAIASIMSFDKLDYIGCGSEVHCTVNLLEKEITEDLPLTGTA